MPWNDADNERFVRENYPQYLELFLSFPEPISRADMDFECLRPFDERIERIDSAEQALAMKDSIK